jgi:hypothetical protein
MMKTVAEYRKFAQDCRELADKLRDPNDKRALLLMAAGCDKVADERAAKLAAGELDSDGAAAPRYDRSQPQWAAAPIRAGRSSALSPQLKRKWNWNGSSLVLIRCAHSDVREQKL